MPRPPTPPDSPLVGFPVVIGIPVQWGDQDAVGHVNNAVYFRWFESARIAYIGRVGLMDRPGGDIGVILAAIACDFRRPVNFPDTIHVGARISRVGRSSMTMEYRVYSEAQRSVVAEGTSTVVSFDYRTGKSQPVSPKARRAIETLEKAMCDGAG